MGVNIFLCIAVPISSTPEKQFDPENPIVPGDSLVVAVADPSTPQPTVRPMDI